MVSDKSPAFSISNMFPKWKDILGKLSTHIPIHLSSTLLGGCCQIQHLKNIYIYNGYLSVFEKYYHIYDIYNVWMWKTLSVNNNF